MRDLNLVVNQLKINKLLVSIETENSNCTNVMNIWTGSRHCLHENFLGPVSPMDLLNYT